MCYLENPCYTGTFWLSPLKKSLKKPSKEPKSRFNSQISFLFIWAQVRYHNTREVATHKEPGKDERNASKPQGDSSLRQTALQCTGGRQRTGKSHP